MVKYQCFTPAVNQWCTKHTIFKFWYWGKTNGDLNDVGKWLLRKLHPILRVITQHSKMVKYLKTLIFVHKACVKCLEGGHFRNKLQEYIILTEVINSELFLCVCWGGWEDINFVHYIRQSFQLNKHCNRK